MHREHGEQVEPVLQRPDRQLLSYKPRSDKTVMTIQDVQSYLWVAAVFWLLSGLLAATVCPARYFGRMLLLTWLFMGPLGIAVALVMTAIQDTGDEIKLALNPSDTTTKK